MGIICRPLAGNIFTGTYKLKVIMAKAKGNREIIKLKSTESSHFYTTTKNKVNKTGKLEIKKFDPVLRKHTVYREVK